MLKQSEDEITETDTILDLVKPQSLSELQVTRPKIHNLKEWRTRNLGILDKIALAITIKIGSMGFFLLLCFWTISWMAWNIFAPKHLQFDKPYEFQTWLFISNLIQISLMPLIMVGQNLQSKHSDIRAENDHKMVLKSEQEIEVVIENLEYQNKMIESIVKKLDIK